MWHLNVESACRDTQVWPSTAEWRIDLSTPLRNVTSVALRSVGLHASEYTVDVWNQWVDIKLGGVVYEVAAPLGMVSSGTALATTLQTSIVATHPALAAFTVVYNSTTDTLTLTETTSAPFTLLWATGPHATTSLWKTMGYTLADTTSTAGGVSVSPGRIDLHGVLAIDVFADELENSVNGPMGRVTLQRDLPGDTPVFLVIPTGNVHTFWPLARLTFLTLRFMVQYPVVDDGTVTCAYRPYVFNGRNNTCQLEFACSEYMNPMEHDVHLDPST